MFDTVYRVRPGDEPGPDISSSGDIASELVVLIQSTLNFLAILLKVPVEEVLIEEESLATLISIGEALGIASATISFGAALGVAALIGYKLSTGNSLLSEDQQAFFDSASRPGGAAGMAVSALSGVSTESMVSNGAWTAQNVEFIEGLIATRELIKAPGTASVLGYLGTRMSDDNSFYKVLTQDQSELERSRESRNAPSSSRASTQYHSGIGEHVGRGYYEHSTARGGDSGDHQQGNGPRFDQHPGADDSHLGSGVGGGGGGSGGGGTD